MNKPSASFDDPFTKKLSAFLDDLYLLPIYAVLFYTMGLPGWAKIFAHEQVLTTYTPMFANTFIDTIFGTSLMVYLLGIMEVLAVIFLIPSLAKLEFLHDKPKVWLKAALFTTLVTFVSLGFGLRLIRNHNGAANLFYYFGVTFFFYCWLVYLERQTAREACHAARETSQQ